MVIFLNAEIRSTESLIKLIDQVIDITEFIK
jgi:hypothetical protein